MFCCCCLCSRTWVHDRVELNRGQKWLCVCPLSILLFTFASAFANGTEKRQQIEILIVWLLAIVLNYFVFMFALFVCRMRFARVKSFFFVSALHFASAANVYRRRCPLSLLSLHVCAVKRIAAKWTGIEQKKRRRENKLNVRCNLSYQKGKHAKNMVDATEMAIIQIR